MRRCIPRSVLGREPPDERAGRVGDVAPRDALMLAVPLAADQITTPAPECVGGDEDREPLAHRVKSLHDGEHEPLFRPQAWPRHLSAQYVQLLAEYEEPRDPSSETTDRAPRGAATPAGG